MDRLVSVAWKMCEKASEQKEKLQNKKNSIKVKHSGKTHH